MPAPLSYLLVDGHSVLHAWPELRRHQSVASKRHLARTELLKRLRHYQDMSGCQIVVVFDGTQAQMSEEREKDGLQIIFADSGNSADHILENWRPSMHASIPCESSQPMAWWARPSWPLERIG